MSQPGVGYYRVGRVGGLSRRTVLVNLVPLLDVLALLIFALHLEGQLAAQRGAARQTALEQQAQVEVAQAQNQARVARQQAAEAAARGQAMADQLAEARRHQGALREDLRQLAGRRQADRTAAARLAEQLAATAGELELARRAAAAVASAEERRAAAARAAATAARRARIATGLQESLGLSETDLTAALRAVPPDPDQQAQLADELEAVTAKPPAERPDQLARSPVWMSRHQALTVHMRPDGALVVGRLMAVADAVAQAPVGGASEPTMGTEITIPAVAAESRDDLASQLDAALRRLESATSDSAAEPPPTPPVMYLLVTWDNVLLRHQRHLARAVNQVAESWRGRVEHWDQTLLVSMIGYKPAARP